MNPIFLFPTVIIEDELNDSSLIDGLISYCNHLKGDDVQEGCSTDIHLNKDNKHVLKVNKLLLESTSKYMNFMKYTFSRIIIPKRKISMSSLNVANMPYVCTIIHSCISCS